MRDILAQFLPSLARGVYRLDQQLCEDSRNDPEGFIRKKIALLPNEHRQFILDELKHLTTDPTNRLFQNHQIPIPTTRTRSVQDKFQKFFSRHTYFANWQNCQERDNYLEVEFVKRILAPLFTLRGLGLFKPQHPVGKYRVDFAVTASKNYAIELDGFGKFDSPDALDRFLSRQNSLLNEGWLVYRYSYRDVARNTAKTAKELLSVFVRDEGIRPFLEPCFADGQHNLVQHVPDFVETVNLFYGVQDYFILEIMNDAKEISIQDKLPFHFPLSALALSSLYKHLDGIREIFDVDFDLPIINVAFPRPYKVNDLHGFIRLVKKTSSGKARSITRDILNYVERSHRWIQRIPNCRFRRRESSNYQKVNTDLEYFAKSIFGYQGTHRDQDRIFWKIFTGKNVLGLLPTGGGKSFCFWLPAILKPGLTIVISPLRSLMRDQDISLKINYGIHSSAFISSDVDPKDRNVIYNDIKTGRIRLLYIAPERLKIRSFREEISLIIDTVPINLLVIDEAHCISEWGHDFRPSYLGVSTFYEDLKKHNPHLTLVALTATASKIVKTDILNILGLDEEDVISAKDFDRPNLSYQIVEAQGYEEKLKLYGRTLKGDVAVALQERKGVEQVFNRGDEKGIGLVFCIFADPHGKYFVRDGMPHYLIVSKNLLMGQAKFGKEDFSTGRIRGYSSKVPTLCPKCERPYYIRQSGMTDSIDAEEEDAGTPADAGQRLCLCGHVFPPSEEVKPPNWDRVLQKNQEAFKYDEVDLLVATKGFGMGIDKGNVRFVLHTSMAGGIESWYQEAGRAGRDGAQAHCVQILDVPNKDCLETMRRTNTSVPPCSASYRESTCKFRKQGRCDYGKQHLLISSNYPSVVADLMRILQTLDMLISGYEAGMPEVRLVTKKNERKVELSLYRLYSIGIIRDFTIEYRKDKVVFEVTGFVGSFERQGGLRKLLDYLRKNDLSEGRSVYDKKTTDELARNEIPRNREKYGTAVQTALMKRLKDRKLKNYDNFKDLFENAIDLLLVILDHIYDQVKGMRYRMLESLLQLARSIESNVCRRVKLLANFQTIEEKYRCGFCDVCVPSLKFKMTFRIPPPDTKEIRELEAIFQDWLENDAIRFDFQTAMKHIEQFSDYPVNMFTRASSVLENSPRNIKALYLAREFAPPELKGRNTLELIKVACSDRDMPMTIRFYETSAQEFRVAQFDVLDDEYGAFKSAEGEEWLYNEAKRVEMARERIDLLATRLVVNRVKTIDLVPYLSRLGELASRESENGQTVEC